VLHPKYYPKSAHKLHPNHFLAKFSSTNASGWPATDLLVDAGSSAYTLKRQAQGQTVYATAPPALMLLPYSAYQLELKQNKLSHSLLGDKSLPTKKEVYHG
jgi:hypothetical protein